MTASPCPCRRPIAAGAARRQGALAGQPPERGHL